MLYSYLINKYKYYMHGMKNTLPIASDFKIMVGMTSHNETFCLYWNELLNSTGTI